MSENIVNIENIESTEDTINENTENTDKTLILNCFNCKYAEISPFNCVCNRNVFVNGTKVLIHKDKQYVNCPVHSDIVIEDNVDDEYEVRYNRCSSCNRQVKDNNKLIIIYNKDNGENAELCPICFERFNLI
jgi:hypothetical protein